jgi:signal transduction histidine kinase
VTIVDELLEIDAFDGKKKTILNYTAPVLDAQGEVLGAIVVNQDITERKQAEKRMQMFSQEIIAAREEERKRVASVLHHDVGSLAVGIAAHLDALEADLRSGKPREALKWMKRTRKLFDESVVRLKKLAIELRPPELDVLGLCAALRQYFAQVTERGGTQIHFRETLGRRRVSGNTATILFRVAQEALTNALKHSRAKQVNVDLRASKEEVTLSVHDNGKGFNPSEQTARATSRMGLRVMREMATAAGGVFTVDSGRGKGTTVRVRLPIADWQKFRNDQSAIA